MSNLTPEEEREHYVKILETLLDRVRSGEMVLRGLNQTMNYERVYNPIDEQWKYFKIGGGTMGFSYNVPELEADEKERMAQYLKDNPSAEIIALDS